MYRKVLMPAPAQLCECAFATQPEVASGIRYVARQPILDLRGKVHGYELLFRNGPEAAFRGDGELATRTMIDNTVLFGLRQLTCGLPAFVNCTAQTLTGDLVSILPSGMAVLEILETVNATPELVSACRSLKASGYRLALDDFLWKPGMDPLVEIADYIKVDFTLANHRERVKLLDRLRDFTVALIAEKVETQEQLAEAREEGFTLIQGYYFCRPTLLENRKIPVNRLSHVEILRVLQDDALDLQELARLVKCDASLTYRLLRLINSPFCAMQQEVKSVQGALIAVGEEMFRRLATLAIASELNAGQPPELLRMALVRGRFCELASDPRGLDRKEQYLLGLLSLLPAMLRLPMRELAPLLPLREEVRQALVGADIEERCLLAWLERHELGDWAACEWIVETHGLDAGTLPGCYEEAVVWAEAALHFA
jgi:EAL and modified HD-GYP domain-containing signal transduction protein